MKKCLDCNCDISDKGTRSVRCDKCQIKHRMLYRIPSLKKSNDKSNKKHGTSRRNGPTYRWANAIKQLSSDDLMALVGIYKERIKHAVKKTSLANDDDVKELRTRLKIITVLYNRAEPSRGIPKFNMYGNDSICDDCQFYNRKQIKCTLHTEDEMDKAIKTCICPDRKYDKEAKFKEEYYKQDIERNNNSDDDLGDYDYDQYDEGEK